MMQQLGQDTALEYRNDGDGLAVLCTQMVQERVPRSSSRGCFSE